MAHQDTAQAKILFKQIAAGNETAFEELFHLYAPKILPVITSVVKTDEPQKDILQEIFLGLWLSRDKLDTIETPHNWIFRMVYHRCYSWLQRQGVRTKASEQLGHLQVAVSNDTEEDLALSETRNLLQQAVNLLPPQARRIYQLSRETDMKIADIASQLSISNQTVKNSLVRSLRFIREYLAMHGIVLPIILLTLHVNY
ncbi:RNA polymerase sigma-70 factor [Chitinophaga sp. Hz27]|uniref:RNA polymerase sigma-70 factor n=1 Tax=Chitinophaga sp. Hz27 TaxID=3347169 RepID=UPI0035E1D948